MHWETFRLFWALNTTPRRKSERKPGILSIELFPFHDVSQCDIFVNITSALNIQPHIYQFSRRKMRSVDGNIGKQNSCDVFGKFQEINCHI